MNELTKPLTFLGGNNEIKRGFLAVELKNRQNGSCLKTTILAVYFWTNRYPRENGARRNRPLQYGNGNYRNNHLAVFFLYGHENGSNLFHPLDQKHGTFFPSNYLKDIP